MEPIFSNDEQATANAFTLSLFKALEEGPLAGEQFCLIVVRLIEPTGIATKTTLPTPAHVEKMEVWARRVIELGAEQGCALDRMSFDGAVRVVEMVLSRLRVALIYGAVVIVGDATAYCTLDASQLENLGALARAIRTLLSAQGPVH